MVPEAGVEAVEFTFGGVVDAHLEETGVGFGGDGGGRKQPEGEEGEQGFHII
jgi:hypothetical protein